LILWWDKLRVGGIMAGHDYWLHYRDEVMAAVNGFVVEKEQILNVTTKERKFPVYPPTWWFIKRAWGKSEYAKALDIHLSRLYAAKRYLYHRKITINLPYEYEAAFLQMKYGENVKFEKAFELELQRLGLDLPNPGDVCA